MNITPCASTIMDVINFEKRAITHKDVVCTGVYFNEENNMFLFRYRDHYYLCTQTEEVSESSDLDHIKCMIERFLEYLNPCHQPEKIEVPCSMGTLCAEVGGDPDYPEIYTYLRRPDGTEIDICVVECTNSRKITAYLNEFPSDCCTKTREWSEDGFKINVEV